MKMVKSTKFKALIFLSLSIFSIPVFSQTKISPYLFGQNAWGPSEIFRVEYPIKSVHYQAIRIGGNGYENENFIFKDAVKLIDFDTQEGEKIDIKFALSPVSTVNAKMNLENGKSLIVTAKNQSEQNVYVKKVTFNGQTLAKPFINYEQLIKGGDLVFEISHLNADFKF
ncbi:MAG: glycoside hydrolase family 92 protein [Bacteroidetes bacterium]|nr:glycoside hydrolase family 92 protein [Bacteroidota bacterium]MBU1371989.1 glycoside hydrolase family 92 protein [Bacteroidota bacterium]MBU1483591.1 glycoside hydrolase family 92 protein [Bacteroidota bacterium]MBU2047108.1 glycoside hydrolase family 92 protein [Bacteroidota bacterium]MBU2267994.1 glycoside hydrolase family 92 protein [Bacteroidota bacterium]